MSKKNIISTLLCPKKSIWALLLACISACGGKVQHKDLIQATHSEVNVARPEQQSAWRAPTIYVAASTVLVDTTGGTCSGVLVANSLGAPRVVFARHCAWNTDATSYTLSFAIRGSTSLYKMNGGGTVRTHPDSDVATLDLGGPLPPDARMAPLLPENGLMSGENVLVAGFGANSSQGTGQGALRWGKAQFLTWMTQQTYPNGTVVSDVLTFKPGAAGTTICAGDSGGPLFALEQGVWGLAGIVTMATAQPVVLAEPVCGGTDFAGADLRPLKAWFEATEEPESR